MSEARSRPRIAVVGSLMTDMVSYLPRLPAAGETVIGGTFELGFGGKGANQAVTARRFGCDVAMIGCLGQDVFGDMTLAHLVDEGLDVSAMQRSDRSPSGVAPIWVEPDGTNRIACAAGANQDVDPATAAAAVEQLRPEVVIGQFEIPQTTTLTAFRAAHRVGARTILNPAPAADIDLELMAGTDWLIPNESEFAHLASLPGSQAISDAVLSRFAATVAPRLLVTLGRDGAALVQPDGTVHRVAAPTVDAVDTTGAGDAFIGAFAAGLAHRLAPEQAMLLALDTATDTVTRPGTQRSLRGSAHYAAVLSAFVNGDRGGGASTP